MSIASQLQAYENGLTDAYNMVSQRGGTMPVHKNMSSLASSIATIPSGGTDYGVPRVQSTDGTTLSVATANYEYAPPSGINRIGNDALQYAFYQDDKIGSADLSNITRVDPKGLFHTFEGSTLSEIDLSALVNVPSNYGLCYALKDCVNIVTLTVGASTGFVTGQSALWGICSGCTALTTATINIKRMNYAYVCRNAFENCTSLTSVSFPLLDSIKSSYKNMVMDDMLVGCSGVTVHFPAGMQSVISTISDLTFGGTNITISYDL